MKAIVTVAPYCPYIDEIVAHPAVSGIRLNTAMSVEKNTSLEDLLKSLQDHAGDKDLWIDLKCRQLRVQGYWTPPYTEIELSHKIKVKTPVTAYFNDGNQKETILKVEENRLYMQSGPRRVVGPGEAVNIPDHSLEIEGFFTDTDKKYIEAGKKVNANKYMLSFVEKKEDIDSFKKIYPGAEILAKIESRKGINYIKNEWKNESGLMTARGDLFLELKMPHYIIEAQELILKKDKNAVIASRILESFDESLEPSCSDINDLDNLMRMGYKRFMFGDKLCMHRNSIISALNLFYEMTERYGGKK